VIVVHETTLSEIGSLEVPEWLQSDPYSVSVIYHTAGNTDDMVQGVLRAKEMKAGYVYITDDVMSNPYDKLPSFYEEEVQILETPFESESKQESKEE